jgi:hypothetical protein
MNHVHENLSAYQKYGVYCNRVESAGLFIRFWKLDRVVFKEGDRSGLPRASTEQK